MTETLETILEDWRQLWFGEIQIVKCGFKLYWRHKAGHSTSEVKICNLLTKRVLLCTKLKVRHFLRPLKCRYELKLCLYFTSWNLLAKTILLTKMMGQP
jgi:hypothetical protein